MLTLRNCSSLRRCLRRWGVRVGLDGCLTAGLPVRFSQLGGFGHAALGYGEDDLACSPAVYWGQPP